MTSITLGRILERGRDLDWPRHYLRRCGHHHGRLRAARSTGRRRAAAIASIEPAAARTAAARAAAGEARNRHNHTRQHEQFFCHGNSLPRSSSSQLLPGNSRRAAVRCKRNRGLFASRGSKPAQAVAFVTFLREFGVVALPRRPVMHLSASVEKMLQ